MKRLSAQYILTNSGPPLKRAVITATDEGRILSVEDTGGSLVESHSVEFYNGIIIPGFVNCHCHLELSHMRGAIPRERGLADFILNIRNLRESNDSEILNASSEADKEMQREGIVLCADICNTPDTFNMKKYSKIHYLNLLEVFGIDPTKASRRFEEVLRLSEIAEEYGIPFNVVPHSVYAVSLPLLRLIKENTQHNKITSIHFLETENEKKFLSTHDGILADSYRSNGLLNGQPETPSNHINAILEEITPSGNLILVHNTFVDREIINGLKQRKNIFWCLCPESNIYIENSMAPADLLFSEGCELVIGTDSLASNGKLSILSELKRLQLNFPSFVIEDLIRWATINGAKALGEEDNFGKIVPGMKPGLLLLENADLKNSKLLPESSIRRLI